ncbi:MAG: hypothetical protein JSV86_17215 [Gemmatimonadota bacterium]|nr:MAG: hypothetical protein JSV86_17215 [Gemmatimonadota bacterium]
MGRLPAEFAGKTITFRIPYSMPGELIVASNTQGTQFPDATFLHNVDKPFEIHRVLVRLTGLDDNDAVIPAQPANLGKLVRLRLQDTSKNEALTKAAHLVDTLLSANTETWDWEDPYTLVRSEGFQVQADTQVLGNVCSPDANCDLVSTAVASVRVEIAFQGYLIVIAPPSEVR